MIKFLHTTCTTPTPFSDHKVKVVDFENFNDLLKFSKGLYISEYLDVLSWCYIMVKKFHHFPQWLWGQGHIFGVGSDFWDNSISSFIPADKNDTFANSVDPYEMVRNIRINTVCHLVLDFWQTPLFATVYMSKLKSEWVFFRKSGVKGLNTHLSLDTWKIIFWPETVSLATKAVLSWPFLFLPTGNTV